MFQLRNSLNLSACAVATAVLLAACGGGDGAKVGKTDNGFTVEGGVAQKGPLAAGSRVTIDELIASTFASAGASYNLQTTGDLGNFDASSLRFTRQHIKTFVSGYYLNELTGNVANDQVSLMAYSDLDVDRLVNVNLLTTLAGPRIEKLIRDNNNTATYRKFGAARAQAQKEVLAAFRIYNGSLYLQGGMDATGQRIVPANFNELDLSNGQVSSAILAALSAVAVKAGGSGAGISEFIADFQADLADDGMINGSAPRTAVRTQIDTASATVDMGAVASSLNKFFNNSGATPAALSGWIDSSGGVDGVINAFKSTGTGTVGTETQSGSYAVGADDIGQCFSVSAGKLYKGTTSTFTPAAGNAVSTGTVKAAAGDFFKIGLTGSNGQTSGFIQRSAQVTTGTGTASVTACPTVAPTANVTRVAMYSRTSDLKAQAALVASAGSLSLPLSGTTTLTTSGGSGGGAVTFAVASGACTISGTTLTAPSSAATCTVTATKAGTAVYAPATSVPITITVASSTGTASTTFLTFDETTAPVLAAFGGDVGTIESDPVVSTNKVLKIVKSAGNESWAGVTMSKCTYPNDSLPVIPLTTTNSTMSLRVYSTVANKTLRLKLENASNGAINVEMDATVAAANTWQTLTFDITKTATNGGNPTRTWTSTDVLNKASVFADFGNSAAVTMYVDDLKFIGSNSVSQTCATAPVTTAPTAAPTAPTKSVNNVVAIYSDATGYTSPLGIDFPNWGDSTVVSDYAIGAEHMLKLATLNYKGITWTTALNLSTYTKLHVDFWSEDATSVDVYLISPGPAEQAVNIPLTNKTWVSSDIDMSKFTTPDKSNIFQIKLVGNPSGKTVYMDNFYFWK